MTHRKSISLFALIFFFPLFSFSQFNFYDEKLNCKLLRDIEFNVAEINFRKDTSVVFFDKEIEAKIFTIKAKIDIQTECSVFGGKWDSAYAYFDFIIGHDSEYTIRDNFLRKIYNYWKSKDGGYREGYISIPCEMSIFYDNGDYLLYKELKEYRQPYFLWYNKRIILVKGIKLEEGKGGWWGTADLFDRLLFRSYHFKRFELKYKSDFPPNDFIMLYEGGKFKQKRWIDDYYENHK
jgi:hypothetical protein